MERHNSADIIDLPPSLLIGRGRERACYLHPHDGDLVIKVAREDSKTGARMNEEEMEGYRLLQHDAAALTLISRCHGFIATSRGHGLICDCIRDADGCLSRTMWELVIHDDTCNIGEVSQAGEYLCRQLMENRIFLFDLNLKNIVLQRDAAGALRPFVIDLKGRAASQEFIPLSRYVPYFALRKLRRRTDELLLRIDEFYRRREELKKLDLD